MEITAQRREVVYADVFVKGCWTPFKVWPDGSVETWAVGDDGLAGWVTYPKHNPDYDAIQAAGLDVLKLDY